MTTQYIEKKPSRTLYYKDKEMTMLHREDGPAVEWEDGNKAWWINGNKLTEEEFNERTNPKKAIIEEIKVLLDKLVE